MREGPSEKTERSLVRSLISMVYGYFENLQKVAAWLKSPNEMLGGLAPRTLIKAGRVEKVYKLVKNAIQASEVPNGGKNPTGRQDARNR